MVDVLSKIKTIFQKEESIVEKTLVKMGFTNFNPIKKELRFLYNSDAWLMICNATSEFERKHTQRTKEGDFVVLPEDDVVFSFVRDLYNRAQRSKREVENKKSFFDSTFVKLVGLVAAIATILALVLALLVAIDPNLLQKNKKEHLAKTEQIQ
ncbi:hypothetical protein D3C87_1379040 [compost metagenome]